MEDTTATKTEREQQIIQQCRAVVHLADAIASVHRQKADLFDVAGLGVISEVVGQTTAFIMETLGDILNGMDANDEEADAWLGPVFAEAQRLWPQPHATRSHENGRIKRQCVFALVAQDESHP